MAFNRVEGDLFDPKWGFGGIGHGVNLKGVMGAGIAKTVREKYPEVYEGYLLDLEGDPAFGIEPMRLGDSFPHIVDSGLVVFNMATQDEPGPNANYHAIFCALSELIQLAELLGVEHIGLPQIGAGIGGLEWRLVEPLIEIHEKKFDGDITVVYYKP